MRRSIPSTAASAPSSSGAVDEPVQTLTVKRSPRAAASVTRPASAAGTAFGWPEPVNPLIPTWSPEAMNAAASSAGITLSARASHRMRDRSVILTLPPAPKRRDDPVSATLRMAGHARPGPFSPVTAYGSAGGRPRHGWGHLRILPEDLGIRAHLSTDHGLRARTCDRYLKTRKGTGKRDCMGI